MSGCDSELNEIVNSLNDNILSTLNKGLRPLINKMNSENKSYNALSKMIRQLPEFKNLLDENIELKCEVRQLKQQLEFIKSLREPETSVKLTVTEPNVVTSIDPELREAEIYLDTNLADKTQDSETPVQYLHDKSYKNYDNIKSNSDSQEDKEEEDEEEEDEEEEEVYEVEIEGADETKYYTNDDMNGNIYEIYSDNSIGSKVGEFKDGEPIFY